MTVMVALTFAAISTTQTFTQGAPLGVQQVSTSVTTVVTIVSSNTTVITQVTVTSAATSVSTLFTISPGVGPGLGIPGYPWESILLGIIVGLTALALVRWRRTLYNKGTSA